MKASVHRDIQGHIVRVGTINTDDWSKPTFSYDAEYCVSPTASPLSHSLPLDTRPYTLDEFRPYFEGLLPEGPALRAIAQSLGIDERDWLSMLFRCGLDCIGDVVVNLDAYEDDRGYRALSGEEFVATFNQMKSFVAVQGASRLSLAGTQGKCGLYHDPTASNESGWYVPYGGAPSNYIVKFSSAEHPHLVLIEQLCMSAARASGMRVCNTFLLSLPHPVLCAERFDREIAFHGEGGEGGEDDKGGDSVATVGSVVAPWRLHQEDLSQAFGLLPGSKYVELEPSTAQAVAAFIRENSVSPAQDIDQFVQLVLFNYLIGNCDNHLKNMSVLYQGSGSWINLAPAYDLVSTTLFEQYTRRMGMKIGSAEFIDEVQPQDFLALAAEVGVVPRLLKRHAHQLVSLVVPALREEASALAKQGFKEAPYLADDIEEDMALRLEVLKQLAG